ncbi:MAG: phenylalanine--tRNA ligase subunit beta [Candidatus Omnitrophica bacterium]|nr:phenylalanine--tRNA ligase subunit beta [Candidatus Omnitrophota bacterium]
MRVSINWLKDYVDIRGPIEALAEKLTMTGLEVTSLTKVDQDTLLEIEVTPNRPDCLSVVGIAREIAAVSGKKLRNPKIPSVRGKSSLRLPIQIQDKRHCPRYLGRIIENVEVRSSPEWLIQRLEIMGVRAVNNIVDITNFCLLELGQPLHAFDLDKLAGSRIIVRGAQAAEQIITIDGVKRELDSSVLVIADKVQPVAIAGIMGGKDSEVTESTRAIVLESAYFDALHIHNTSRRLGLATQSSYRFERGVDLAGVALASLRATELIKNLARPSKKTFVQVAGRAKSKFKPMVIGGLIDKGLKSDPANKVRLRYARLNQVLGIEVSPAQIKEILRRLQFSILRRSKLGLVAKAPSFRLDVSREADLIEEVGRLYGYDQVPLSLADLAPDLSSAGKLQLESDEIFNLIRRILSSLGLNEIVTYSLISRQGLRKLDLPQDGATIAVKNPLSYTQEILRPTLLVGMLNSLVANLNRNNNNLKLFELSRVYTRDGSNPQELTNLCIGIAGRRENNWLRKSDEYSFFDLKGIVEALLNKLGLQNFKFVEEEAALFTRGRCAKLMLGEENFGLLGELCPATREKFDLVSSVYVAELALHKLLKAIHQEKKFTPLAKFPAVERDISLIAPPEVRSEQIVSLIKEIGRDLVTKATLFDQYFGEQIPQGFRGLSFSIEYRSHERTLTAEEVDQLHAQIRKSLVEALAVQLR